MEVKEKEGGKLLLNFVAKGPVVAFEFSNSNDQVVLCRQPTTATADNFF